MTITITGLPLQGTILDNTLIPVETSGVTGHITAQSVKTYLSAGTLSSLTAGTATITGILTADSVYSTHLQVTDIETTSDVDIGGNLTIGGFTNFGNITVITGVNSFSNLSANVGTVTSWFNNLYANNANQITANIHSSVVPSANLSANIGTSTRMFNNVYANTASFLTATVNSGGLRPSSNLVANIGSSTEWFNTIYGTANRALYADLAEKYTSDADYEPGTVVVFGESTEVTISNGANDTRVAGVVSTNPAYLMNGGIDGVEVALQGRVPCKVTGRVRRGDIMVTSDIPGVAMVNNEPKNGTIIGKSLGYYLGDEIGVVEVVVGRT